ncbi:hypothetical protein [Arthrobacter nitrophenolicus]|nr:hypothetical protein [Arthrobacter nitrophenolicus]
MIGSLLVLRAYAKPPQKPDHSVAASLALVKAPDPARFPRA